MSDTPKPTGSAPDEQKRRMGFFPRDPGSSPQEAIPSAQTVKPAGQSEVWEVGQHPAVSNGWIVRPVLFGSRVRVLPEHEGGHVLIRSERDARLIAAAPDLLAAIQRLIEVNAEWVPCSEPGSAFDQAKDAVSKATGEPR
jgi:hypothetical protein